MTDNDNILDGLTDESRRSFMKKSAIASGGLAMGLSGTGTVAAQDGNNQDNVMRGLMFNTQFHPRAQFTIASQQIDWAPVETDEEGDNFLNEANDELLFDNPQVFANFNTRVINYQIGRQSWAMLFIQQDANIQQGQMYELSPAFNPFGRDDFQQFGIDENVNDDLFTGNGGNELGMVTVQFSPVQGGGGGQGTTTTQGGGGNETDGTTTDAGN